MGRKVKVVISRVVEVEVPDEIYEAAQYEPYNEWSDSRWDQWQDAVNAIGKMVGYDADPEEGCEWFDVEAIEYGGNEPYDGLIAMVDEDNNVMAKA